MLMAVGFVLNREEAEFMQSVTAWISEIPITICPTAVLYLQLIIYDNFSS